MADNIVEIGFLLENNLDFYENILEKSGADKVFECETHDRYWTNKNYDELINLTENQIKKSCVRLRECSSYDSVHCVQSNPSFHFDNCKIFDKNLKDIIKLQDNSEIKNYISKLEENGWYLIFDTFKRDYHYATSEMKSRIQLQEIDDIGLVLYYDNPDYYKMPENLQRESIIDELNGYGFNFNYNEQDIDKLRTRLTGQTCFSLNQNK